ncbi:RNA polymerase sigma factor [Cohnella panacarvi]|uniref:RNA polymerase sigma factor n=1 Tax=Cohnella panacarvi TaxID=400776 RepID=UPI00047B11B0|nr:sigma-70 family RNA polymerase sigma factor [Cohnella panacarvi]
MQTSLLLLLGSNFHRLSNTVQEQIYREFYQFLYSPIMFMISDHSATEDIIHDTFLMTLRKSPEVESEEHLKAWIKVVSRNFTYTYLRKRKRQITGISLDDERADLFAYQPPVATSVEQEVVAKSLEEQIGKHLQELKEDQRAIVELKWKKGLSYKEIASQIDDTENGVRRKLHRARVLLKKKLSFDWGDRHE